MPELLRRLFSSDGFMPHGHCYLWRPEVVWLHVVSDALVALSYTTIPFTLYFFVRKRKDIPFTWMFYCFALFIVACGATHYLEIWTLWTPAYWLSGVVKAITAAASVPTAILLVKLLPKALAIPHPNILREAHANLERSERRFRALLEATPDAMVIVDQEGLIVLVNAQAESLFGYDREDLIGRPVELLMPERVRGVHLGHRRRFSEEASRVRPMGSGLNLFGRRKDESEFPIEVSLSPLQTDDGLLILSAIRDVSERKETEAALKLANQELEAFSYSVAHDLRAPLRGMHGFAQLLLEEHGDALTSTGRDYIERITTNATRMAELIDALLSLSRTTRADLKAEKVDLGGIARAVHVGLAAAEPEREVELVVADGLEAVLDPALARTLFENLLGNAWKFTQKADRAQIEVGANHSAGATVFHVRDNGAGFQMEYAKKLFAPFQRLHVATDYPGTGIGLATVQRIVHRHGGEIWAEGSVGAGATFYFTFGKRIPSPKA
jgi:PAS domain S-box-containing protein